ncbi:MULTISPECIES: rhamnan synthesis F family protein [Nitrospirillum]|uniref:Rhamnan synthesis protein F n=1 Tax=Nitrospirillum amazonense TaxID=28077 RepID=A0A560G3G2_9PROT|nr:rhamnan synthesis F family protein [Nitrospirillum amazonense]MEC4591989.1 rhamnan synthesis F family protein [Nitrospirillum amazonense]TWB28382.1 rhamnan synthesis protein F [Nitrospirillum amazonense]
MRDLFRRIVRQVAYRSRLLITRTADYAELLLFPPPPAVGRIEKSWTGQVSLDGAARVAVFMHFARTDTIAPYVRYHVRKLREAGFAVVFASNTPCLSDQTVAPLLPDVALAFSRQNIGWDFAAYREAISLVPALEKRDMLLITNDSVFGPLYDLDPLIARASPAEADIWGSTDSWERHYHLQSFFLLFHQRALRSEAFRRFWDGVRCFRRKHWIIEKYEIGLTRMLQDGGLRCKALFPYNAVTETFMRSHTPRTAPPKADRTSPAGYAQMLANRIKASIPINQTHFFWYELTVGLGFPFIKRELLQKNPANIPNVGDWEYVVSRVSNYDTGLIREHLSPR